MKRGAPPGPGWPSWLTVTAPSIIAFAVAEYGIARPSLWRDETYTIMAASRSPSQILALLRDSDAVHGAYYMCMHVVIAMFGRSETVVRTPSAVATAFSAGMVAALGIRLAALSGGRWPRTTGLLAGLLYAIAPMVTRYAQEARSYATVTGFVVMATYALVRALDGGGRRWWAGYAAAIAATGLFNMFGLLIVPAHAVTVLMIGRSRSIRRWAVAVTSAAVPLIPVAIGAYLQRNDTAWLSSPNWGEVGRLVRLSAGSGDMVVPVWALVVIAVCAGLANADRRLTVAVGLPWLVLPPVILLVAAQLHPVYDIRYIVFCLPAVALLAADGLSWLATFTAGLATSIPAFAAWVPALAVAAIIALAAVAPQHSLRTPWWRADNLRKVSWIVKAYERPGDAVLYITSHSRILGQAYPGPFRKLRDIALRTSPIASATLNGIEVRPAVLRRRFLTVKRVWVISGNGGERLPTVRSGLDAEKLALIAGMRRLASWHAAKDLVLLYARR